MRPAVTSSVESIWATAWSELLGEAPESEDHEENAGKAFSFHSMMPILHQRYGLVVGDGVSWRLGRCFYRQWLRRHPDAAPLRTLEFRLLPLPEQKKFAFHQFCLSLGLSLVIESLPDAAWLLQLDAPVETTLFWIGAMEAMLAALSGDKSWSIEPVHSSESQKTFLLLSAKPL